MILPELFAIQEIDLRETIETRTITEIQETVGIVTVIRTTFERTETSAADPIFKVDWEIEDLIMIENEMHGHQKEKETHGEIQIVIPMTETGDLAHRIGTMIEDTTTDMKIVLICVISEDLFKLMKTGKKSPGLLVLRSLDLREKDHPFRMKNEIDTSHQEGRHLPLENVHWKEEIEGNVKDQEKEEIGIADIDTTNQTDPRKHQDEILLMMMQGLIEDPIDLLLKEYLGNHRQLQGKQKR